MRHIVCIKKMHAISLKDIKLMFCDKFADHADIDASFCFKDRHFNE